MLFEKISGKSLDLDNLKQVVARSRECSELWKKVLQTAASQPSPLTFFDELAMPEGSAYGPQFCLGQYNPGARTKVEGLLLGGQGTLMPGVVGASLSGLIAAGEIEGLEPLWKMRFLLNKKQVHLPRE